MTTIALLASVFAFLVLAIGVLLGSTWSSLRRAQLAHRKRENAAMIRRVPADW